MRPLPPTFSPLGLFPVMHKSRFPTGSPRIDLQRYLWLPRNGRVCQVKPENRAWPQSNKAQACIPRGSITTREAYRWKYRQQMNFHFIEFQAASSNVRTILFSIALKYPQINRNNLNGHTLRFYKQTQATLHSIINSTTEEYCLEAFTKWSH